MTFSEDLYTSANQWTDVKWYNEMFNKLPMKFYNATASSANVTGYKMPMEVGPILPISD